jgi:hypothetical protein
MKKFAAKFKPIHLTSYDRNDAVCAITTNDFPHCAKDAAEEFHQLTRKTTFTWSGGVVHFYYHTDSNPNVDVKFQHIATLLSAIQPKNVDMNAHLLLTRSKKTYPKGVVFGPEHANTGWAIPHEKIVVYREEEWLKVFIHECFHFFKFDDGMNNDTYMSRMHHLFHIHNEILPAEMYCEFYARVINCIMISMYADIPLSILLRAESKYSVRHMVNVLHHMKVNYTDLLHVENTYEEDTNMLAYTVLTGILMGNKYYKYIDFLSYSQPFISKSGRDMQTFIKEHYKTKPFLETVAQIVPHVTTTMTKFSIDNYVEMKNWKL